MKSENLLAGIAAVSFLVLMLVQPVVSGEKATKEECIAKVDEAIALIQKEGPDSSFEKIMAKTGPFTWKDSYVFCMSTDMGKTLAHPVSRLIGFPMVRFKDSEGKQPFVEVLETANSKGKGWKNYMYAAPGESEPRLKTIYFAKVPDHDVIVCAGYYE